MPKDASGEKPGSQVEVVSQQPVNIVERLRLLQEHRSPDLVYGQWLAQYPFNPQRLAEIFLAEPHLPQYLYSFDGAGPESIAGWESGRVEKARQMRNELIIELLPLTLRIVYDEGHFHWQNLRSLSWLGGMESVNEYLQIVMLQHIEMVGHFRWDRVRTMEDAVHLFLGYADSCLHPSKIREQVEADALEEIDKFMEVPHHDDTIQLEMDDALGRFRGSLAESARPQLDRAISNWAIEGKKRRSIRRDSVVQHRLRKYLRDSGFRPELRRFNKKAGHPRSTRTIGAENGTETKIWQRVIPQMRAGWEGKRHLLTDTQVTVMEAMAQVEWANKSFMEYIAQVAGIAGTSYGEARRCFWEAKQRLNNEAGVSGFLAYRQLREQTTRAVLDIVARARSEGRIHGYSDTESAILRSKAANPKWTGTQISEDLKLSESTVNKALRKALRLGAMGVE